jgi:hypothetical protein
MRTQSLFIIRATLKKITLCGLTEEFYFVTAGKNSYLSANGDREWSSLEYSINGRVYGFLDHNNCHSAVCKTAGSGLLSAMNKILWYSDSGFPGFEPNNFCVSSLQCVSQAWFRIRNKQTHYKADRFLLNFIWYIIHILVLIRWIRQ